MSDDNYYDPQNHPYTEHQTYTGQGCAICGKAKDEHAREKGERDGKG